jgi:PEP-CTERM motif
LLKLKPLLRIAIATFVLSFLAIDSTKAQLTGDPPTSPTSLPTNIDNPRSQTVILTNTQNFDDQILIIQFLNEPDTYPQPIPTPGSTPPSSYPPGVKLYSVLVCSNPPKNKQPWPVNPSPCTILTKIADFAESGVASGKCEIKWVPLNITALKAVTTQPYDEKLIEPTRINISSIFDSATQKLLGIKSQLDPWGSWKPSPALQNQCSTPWPPIIKPTPTPSPSPPTTPVPEPSTILGFGIGLFCLGWHYKKHKIRSQITQIHRP